MHIDLIKEPFSYAFERTIAGVTKKGRGPVVQKYYVKGRGWYVIIDPVGGKRPLTFRPAHIVGRVSKKA